MSEQTLHLVQIIRERLRATIRRITLADLLHGLLLTLGVVSGLWLIAVAVEAGFWLGTTPRTVLFWLLLAVAVVLVAYYLLRPLLQLLGILGGPSEEVVARRIGSRYPEVSDRLVNLLHLVEGRRTHAPAPLIDGAVRMLGEQVNGIPFEQVEDFERARKIGRLASLPVVGLLLFLLAAPNAFLEASTRLFSPGEHFQRPAPFALEVVPGNVTLVKGSTLEITARASGRELPSRIKLTYQNLDEERVEEVELVADSAGVFRHAVVNLRKSLRYRLEARPVRTNWFTAVVNERPLVRHLQVELDFPNYTGIPSQRLVPNAGDVTALPGTQVSVEVGLGGNAVTEAFVQFDDGTLDTLAVEEDRATGSFTLMREGTYRILLRNAVGIENEDPIAYTLKLLADAHPSVIILEPEPTTDITDALHVPVRYRINDDFGFARLRLYYRLAESRFSTPQEQFQAIELPLEDPRQLDQEGLVDWFITEQTGLDPVPGDVIEYYIQVWDNDTVAGYKSARSATHRLRLPSLAEQYEQVEQQQNQAEDSLQDMVRETERIQEQFRQLRDELRRKQEGDWEDKRQLEQIQQRQEQLEQRVEDLSEQIESVTEKMQEGNLVDEETLEMYQELQRVVEEINSPELMEALRQLQEAIEQLDLQQMQEAIQNFEFNEEQYKQRLERTLDLFKRLQVQQKLDEVARRAEELARQQEHLAEETRKLQEEETQQPDSEEKEPDSEKEPSSEQEDQGTDAESQERDDPSEDRSTESEGEQQDDRSEDRGDESRTADEEHREELAREQERSSDEMQQLEEKLEEIERSMQELRNTPQQQLQQLNEQTQQQQLPERMRENAEQLRENKLQDAQQQQQQMQQQLQQLSQQLQQMQQQMQGQQMQLNMAGLRRALSDVLRLSEQQESLRGDVNTSADDSPRLRDFAQRQVELSEGLGVVSDTLQRLSSQIPQMTREIQRRAGEASRSMQQATTALSERASRVASSQQKASMMHLNELALLLSDLMNQMMNAQSGGSGSMSMQQMIQQLQKMAGEQQKLNEQIQQLLNDVQGNRLSTDMQQRLQQMARQQEALRRQLQEMAKNKELNEKALGDLNKIAEQMEETIEELQRGQVDRPLIRRQQQILTRLLDASRSLRERGKEEKREGRTADDILRESPEELTPAEEAERLRRALLKALESGYAPDYEELIKRYFELLQQQEN